MKIEQDLFGSTYHGARSLRIVDGAADRKCDVNSWQQGSEEPEASYIIDRAEIHRIISAVFVSPTS